MKNLAHPIRFERTTFAFGGQRSIQLSYGCIGPDRMAGTIQEAGNAFNPRKNREKPQAGIFSGAGGWDRRSMKAMPTAERMNTVWITVCRMMPVTV